MILFTSNFDQKDKPQMKNYTSLLDPLQHQAQTQPNRTMLTFLHEDQTVAEQTSQKIWEEIQRFAATLHKTGIQSGDLVILVLPQSLELVYAFLGAVYLSAVPSIFAFLSPRMGAEIYHQRVHSLVANKLAN